MAMQEIFDPPMRANFVSDGGGRERVIDQDFRLSKMSIGWLNRNQETWIRRKMHNQGTTRTRQRHAKPASVIVSFMSRILVFDLPAEVTRFLSNLRGHHLITVVCCNPVSVTVCGNKPEYHETCNDTSILALFLVERKSWYCCLVIMRLFYQFFLPSESPDPNDITILAVFSRDLILSGLVR